MSNANLKNQGHSADVRTQLYLNGSVLGVAQLGPDILILNAPADHPPAEAEIALQIDGNETRWPVWLIDGLAPDRRKTRIASSKS